MVRMVRTVRMVHMGRMVLTVHMASGRSFWVGLSLLVFGGVGLVFAAQVKPPKNKYHPQEIYTNLPKSKAGLKDFLFQQCLSGPIPPHPEVPPDMEVEYGLCKSLEAGNPRFCKTLTNKMSARVCEGRYGLLSFLIAAVKGSPEAVSQCSRGDHNKRGPGELGGERF